jgi:hypothetical protein
VNIIGSDENQWLTQTFDPALLRTGTNVLAVEIHQNTVSSPDISFDFSLEALTALAGVPRLTASSLAGALRLAWPADLPDFRVVSATNLEPPIVWRATTNEPAFLNGAWQMSLPSVTDGVRLFKLQSP